jgi:hypothetical protein
VTLEVRLHVWLKGVDLVANTAFLTLTEKLGYADRLLGLARLDIAEFTAEVPDADAAARQLSRLFAGSSAFYNRNKHSYFLDFRVSGKTLATDGTPREDVERRLAAEVGRAGGGEEKHSREQDRSVIFKQSPVFRTQVLVEEREPSARIALARTIEDELGQASVAVSALGVCWVLALAAPTEEEASAVTEEIVVSLRRDRGLLMNPNDQEARVLDVSPLAFTQND